jgi:dihydropyrimidinase
VAQFDLAVRGGTIATPAINLVPISAFAKPHREPTALSGRRRRSMRRAWWRCPRISQRSGPDVVMADDFASATRAAAAVGNTPPAVRSADQGLIAHSRKVSLDNSRLKPKGSAKGISTSECQLERATTGLKGQRLPVAAKRGRAIGADPTCWSVT